MDRVTKAITVKSADYKENDKLIELFSLEYGKITVQARGIKKSNAKLKFAQELFCFAEYELAEKGDRYTLTGCKVLESFYAIREDIVKYYAACVMLQCLDLMQENETNAELFVATLKGLQALDDGVDPLLTALKYLTDYLKASGFELQLDRCGVCGERRGKHMYLDLRQSGAVCENCRSADSLLVPGGAVSVLAMTMATPTDKLQNLRCPDAAVKEALRCLSLYLSHVVGKVASISELLKL